MRDDEWVIAERQPTYEPGEGVTVEAIPVMEKKKPKPHKRPTTEGTNNGNGAKRLAGNP